MSVAEAILSKVQSYQENQICAPIPNTVKSRVQLCQIKFTRIQFSSPLFLGPLQVEILVSARRN